MKTPLQICQQLVSCFGDAVKRDEPISGGDAIEHLMPIVRDAMQLLDATPAMPCPSGCGAMLEHTGTHLYCPANGPRNCPSAFNDGVACSQQPEAMAAGYAHLKRIADGARHTPGQILSAFIEQQMKQLPANESANTESFMVASAALGKLRHMEDVLAGMNPEAVKGLIASVEDYLQVNSVSRRNNMRAALAALKPTEEA